MDQNLKQTNNIERKWLILFIIIIITYGHKTNSYLLQLFHSIPVKNNYVYDFAYALERESRQALSHGTEGCETESLGLVHTTYQHEFRQALCLCKYKICTF